MTSHNGHDNPQLTRNLKERPSDRPPAPPLAEKKANHFWLWFSLLLVVLVVTVGFVLWRQHEAGEALASSTQQMAVPTVLVAHPERGDSQVHLTYPGTVDPFMESSIYAQVSGYIKRWLVDIGSQVKTGQLLAEIETPVTDQQLLQSQESVKQAQANLDLAKVTANRYNSLFSTHAVSQQDIDNENAGVKVQEANLSAAQAFEAGIEKTEAFKEVRAPFDGVVTARQIDVGDYVSATGQAATANASGSGPSQTGTPNQELFRIAQIHTLRVYVNVPEHYADLMVVGTQATLELTSSPNHTVMGTLVRTADAIDPTSLTLLAEVDVDNPTGSLLPGGYAQVHFDVITDRPPLIIPGNSLIFRQQGPQVGVVDDSNTVHLQNVKIGRDLGTKLEITDGLKIEDSVIVNPSDSLADGQKVNVNRNASSSSKP